MDATNGLLRGSNAVSQADMALQTGRGPNIGPSTPLSFPCESDMVLLLDPGVLLVRN